MPVNYLSHYEWELLSEPVELTRFADDLGLKVLPSRIVIQRRDNMSLQVTGSGTGLNDFNKLMRPPLPPGSFIQGNSVKGATEGFTSVEIHDAIVNPSNLDFNGEYSFDLHTNKVTASYDKRPVAKTVLFLINGPNQWNAMTRRETNINTKIEREFPNTKHKGYWSYQFTGKTQWGGSRDSLLLQTNEGEFLLSAVPSTFCKQDLLPVSLTFPPGDKYLDKELRDRVVDAISFALGRQMIEIGMSHFDHKGRLIERESTTPWSPNMERELRTKNSSPLQQDRHFPDTKNLSRIVDGILTNYDVLKLGNVLTHLRTARASQLGPGLIFYAAALESLAKAWFESPKGSKQDYLIEPTVFEKTLGEELGALLSKVPKADPSWVKIYNTLKELNRPSGSQRMTSFLEQVKSPLGKVEKETLKSRNYPAHGHVFGREQYDNLLRVSDAYMALVHRTILKATGGAYFFTDYSTIGYPLRSVDATLGGPEGDGEFAKL